MRMNKAKQINIYPFPMRPKALFLTEATLKQRDFIDDNFNASGLKTAIISVMEEKMHPALGTNLYNRLQTGIVENNLTAEETALLNDYITPCMIYYVMEEAIFFAHIKIRNTGLATLTPDNTQALSMSDMYSVMERFRNKAEYQEQRLIKYLQANASKELFPEYILSSASVDQLQPNKNAYTCPIVL
jgi:hypothetical protein